MSATVTPFPLRRTHCLRFKAADWQAQDRWHRAEAVELGSPPPRSAPVLVVDNRLRRGPTVCLDGREVRA